MTVTDAREDLVRGLLQSCYVIEHARVGVQELWGGGFTTDAGRTRRRAERLGLLLDEMRFRRPDDVIDEHTRWFEALVGKDPTEVPLGAAVLHTFGKWSDVFCEPYLGSDLADFVALGAEHTRVEMDVRMMNEDEAFIAPAPLPQGHRFAILTDIHIGSARREVLARQAVADINAAGVEFVVIPGDITEDGEPQQFRDVKAILDELTCPYYVVPGNHDAIQRSTREPRCAEFWRAAFGTDPTDHVVECGGLQIALVDSTDPTASPFPDWDVSKGSVGGVAAGVDSGALRPGQMDELVSRLDKGKPVLLVQHHELHPFPGFPPVKFALREEDAEAELAALSGFNLVGVVAGHTHRSARLGVGDGSVTQVELPALKDWPFAYTVAGVHDGGLDLVVRQVSDREAVWSHAKGLLPLMRRFAIGPLSDLTARLPIA